MTPGDIVEWKPAIGGRRRGRVYRIDATSRVYIHTGHRGGDCWFDPHELHRLTVTATMPPKLRRDVVAVLRWVARRPCVEDNCGTACKCEPCMARGALDELGEAEHA